MLTTTLESSYFDFYVGPNLGSSCTVVGDYCI